jgi:hypothetical protein
MDKKEPVRFIESSVPNFYLLDFTRETAVNFYLLSVCLSVFRFYASQGPRLSVYLLVSVCLSICLFLFVSFYVCLSICLSACRFPSLQVWARLLRNSVKCVDKLSKCRLWFGGKRRNISSSIRSYPGAHNPNPLSTPSHSHAAPHCLYASHISFTGLE